MTNNVVTKLLIAMIKPVTLNDLPIIKCVYLDVFLVNYNMIKLNTCKTKKIYILFVSFVTWQLLNTIGRLELFPSAGTVVVFRCVMLDSG